MICGSTPSDISDACVGAVNSLSVRLVHHEEIAAITR